MAEIETVYRIYDQELICTVGDDVDGLEMVRLQFGEFVGKAEHNLTVAQARKLAEAITRKCNDLAVAKGDTLIDTLRRAKEASKA